MEGGKDRRHKQGLRQALLRAARERFQQDTEGTVLVAPISPSPHAVITWYVEGADEHAAP